MFKSALKWKQQFLYVNGEEIYQFKTKHSEILPYPLCVGNISRDYTNDNMKKTRFNGYMFDSSINYNTIEAINTVDVHKYLMKNFI